MVVAGAWLNVSQVLGLGCALDAASAPTLEVCDEPPIDVGAEKVAELATETGKTAEGFTKSSLRRVVDVGKVRVTGDSVDTGSQVVSWLGIKASDDHVGV